MEGRHVFEHLTVEDNLLAGGYTRRNGPALKADLERVYGYFSSAAGPAHRPGRLHLGRRAADARDRAGALMLIPA